MSNFAGFGSRFGAVIVDGIVLFLIGLPFDVVGWFGARKAFENCYSIKDLNDGTTSIHCPGDSLQVGWLVAAIGLFVLGAIVGLIIYCKKVASGQSWGHKATGIRIVDANSGQSISAGRVFGRQIARILSGLFCYLGYLWMLWDPRKQTWHDKIVSTVVVRA
jgi:uncharacterized RDD family membrane protein YckC